MMSLLDRDPLGCERQLCRGVAAGRSTGAPSFLRGQTPASGLHNSCYKYAELLADTSAACLFPYFRLLNLARGVEHVWVVHDGVH